MLFGHILNRTWNTLLKRYSKGLQSGKHSGVVISQLCIVFNNSSMLCQEPNIAEVLPPQLGWATSKGFLLILAEGRGGGSCP